jgi:catechol 2,3-dioxygenase-like lactoylglutathione lyase family enzyme
MKASIQGIHPVLMTRDVAESIRFYARLGFAVSFQDAVDQPKYAAVRRDHLELHLQGADPDQWAYPTDRPAYRFLVSDVAQLYAEFQQAGVIGAGTSDGSPWAAPANTPWGTHEFHLRDPGKNCLQFYAPI